MKTTSILGWHEGKLVTKESVFGYNMSVDSELSFQNEMSILDFKVNKPECSFEEIAQETLPLIFDCHPLPVTLGTTGWFVAACLSPYIREKTNSRFPLLNVSGPRGSGKSNFVKILWRMIGVYNEPFRFTTNFVMTLLLSGNNTIPVVFDEYDLVTLEKDRIEKIQLKLKMAYQVVDSRTEIDQSLDFYPLMSPAVVIGESPFEDIALQERAVHVYFQNTSHSYDKKVYSALMQKDLSSFSYGFFHYLMDYMEQQYLEEDLSYGKNMVGSIEDISDQSRMNAAILVFGIRVFTRLLKSVHVPIEFKEEDILHVAKQAVI